MSLTSLSSDATPGPAWPPAEFTLKLRKPVTDAAGAEIAELRLHEPTDAEWTKILAYDKETRRRFLISHISGIPMEAAAKLAIGDALMAENYCMAFFDLGEATMPWSQPSSPTSTAGAPPTSDS